MKNRSLLFVFMIAFTAVAFGGCDAVHTPENGIGGIIVSAAPDGGVYLDIPVEAVEASGLSLGDGADILLSRKLTLTRVPYYSGAYAASGQPYLTDCISPDSSVYHRLELHAANGGDLYAQAGLSSRSHCALAIRSPGLYADVEKEHVLFGDALSRYTAQPFSLPDFAARDDIRILVTEFDRNSGAYTVEGSLKESPQDAHSQWIPVCAGKTYYCGFRDDDVSCAGAFFDGYGRWLAPLTKEAFSPVSYRVANGIPGSWRMEDEVGSGYVYVRLFCFTVPSGARFLSLNLNDKPEYAYRQYISTACVFAHSDTGNYVWTNAEPLLAESQSQRICIIGQSSVMIDRCLRKVRPENEEWEFLCGFQEYLAPWFATVDSFGFSGKGYMKNGKDGIYDFLIDDIFDLSSYDIYFFLPGANALNLSNMGGIDSNSAGTYFGALNILIDKILSKRDIQCPPRVILATDYDRYNAYQNEKVLRQNEIQNEKIRAFSERKGAELIDIRKEYTVDQSRIQEWTYDGVHPNQTGGNRLGELYRRFLLGF